ncbi:MAG TPA: RNA polymerase sigma factor SigJ [Pseudonocardiaceae bacterium]|jgi:RNA polymerase sigma-70 factor (ECF subfamily)|nr:RNA polymerase sigma factor SigJ [Pseudonocardiaceae bacterium]
MDDTRELANRFEAQRDRLRGVAYRMLGSVSEAEDAVQEAWLRLQRADTSEVANLAGWLTTVVGRVCLDLLRTRVARREEFVGAQLPDPIVRPAEQAGPETEALLADSVGLALLIVLDALDPAERLAFVLHDMFALPFEEIAGIVGRSTAATRQLASRARRRVQGSAPTPAADLARQRAVVNAFFAAAHDGDLDALVAVLDPDVVLRAEDAGTAAGTSRLVRGAKNVASRAMAFAVTADPGLVVGPVLVNGTAGLMASRDGTPQVVFAVTVASGKIAGITIYADPVRLRRLSLPEPR